MTPQRIDIDFQVVPKQPPKILQGAAGRTFSLFETRATNSSNLESKSFRMEDLFDAEDQIDRRRISVEEDSLQSPVADQSTCAGVGLGVTEGEGNSVGVEKVEAMGLLLGDGLSVGTGMIWGRMVVTLAGVAAAAAACAPAFVFAVVFAPPRRFVPICVVAVELPLELPRPAAAPPVIPPV